MERRFIVVTEKATAHCQTESFEFKLDDCKEKEAIIETSLSLISAGTELSRVYAIKTGFSYPVYPGYTAIGKVLAKGSGLPDFEVGDRVFYAGPHASINRYCHQGTTQGAKIMKIDNRLSDKQACLIQMGLIAMNAITANNGNITDTAVVYGLGTIGLITALLLKKSGMRVIAFDPIESRCQLAKSLKIEEAFSCSPQEQKALLKQLTFNKGADVSVDASGISSAIATAIEGAAKHGQVILLGSPRASYTCDITTIFNTIHMKMLQVQGAFNELNPYPVTDGTRRNVLKDFAKIQQLILDNTLDADKLISHIITPDQIMEAYHGLMYEREKWHCAIIDWTR